MANSGYFRVNRKNRSVIMNNNKEINNNEPSEDDDSKQSGSEDGASYAREADRQKLINLARHIPLYGHPKTLKVLMVALGDDNIDYFTSEKDNLEYVRAFVIAALRVYRKWGG
jgi:hypothetical protein